LSIAPNFAKLADAWKSNASIKLLPAIDVAQTAAASDRKSDFSVRTWSLDSENCVNPQSRQTNSCGKAQTVGLSNPSKPGTWILSSAGNID
jgi:hypothetical protein